MLDAAGYFESDIGDALTGGERSILSAWDSGADYAAIATATGYCAKTVRDVVSRYDDRPDGPRVPPSLVAANMAHVAAVARVMGRKDPPKQRPIDVDEIVAMLTGRIEQLVADLLPNGWREGHEWVTSNIHDVRTGSTSLRVNIGPGVKRGWWKDFASHDKKGNPLWLIAWVACNGDVKAAVQWAKGWLNIDGAPPADIERLRIEARAAGAERAAQVVAERQRGIDRARKRWLEADVLAAGDPVARYLAARGMDFAALGKFPGALRYHRALQYGYSPSGPQTIVPAMVAAVYGLDGKQIATHRTYLDIARDAKAGAALIGLGRDNQPNDPKKIMGSPMGGHIPIWKGAHDCTLREIPPGTDVIAGEGIEDSGTAACALPDARVICFISLSYLAALDLPPQMGRLILLKQNDPAGSEAARAFGRAVQAHRDRGRTVLIAPPPKGVKDLNDLAMGKVA